MLNEQLFKIKGNDLNGSCSSLGLKSASQLRGGREKGRGGKRLIVKKCGPHLKTDHYDSRSLKKKPGKTNRIGLQLASALISPPFSLQWTIPPALNVISSGKLKYWAIKGINCERAKGEKTHLFVNIYNAPRPNRFAGNVPKSPDQSSNNAKTFPLATAKKLTNPAFFLHLLSCTSLPTHHTSISFTAHLYAY